MDRITRGAQSSTFVIAAGDRVPVMGQAQFVRCLEANGPFFVSVNNGQEMYFASGIQYTAPGLEDFQEFALINKSGAPVTVTMAWGFGELTDNRLTATGNLSVINAPATKLDVDDADTQTALASILAMLQNDRLQRKPLTTLLGATRATYNNSNPTIVSSGANVNGVIIRFLHMGSTSAVNTSLSIGGTVFVQMRGDADGGDPQVWFQDIFVPAGLAITAIVPAFGDLSICYEVL